MDRRTASIAVAVVSIAVVDIFGFAYISGYRVRLDISGPARSHADISGPARSDVDISAAARSDDTQRLSDMSSLKDALNKYFNDEQSYPATPAADRCSGNFNNVVNLSSALVPKYISSIPKDPHPRACEYNYLYVASPDGKSYALLVDLQDIDPATYSDRWCIGASAGTVAAIARDAAGTSYLPCPDPARSHVDISGPARSDDAQRLSDMSSLKDALNKYFNDAQSYPATPPSDRCSGNFNNVVNLSSALVPKYISSIPKDPHPRACEYNYLYVASPDGKSYALLVDLQDIDPAAYSDRWCIGASAGTVAAIAHDAAGTSYLPCPP